ncbi:MAG: class I SAM-dependent methyltransferase [Deltaproteobacteria bacterium]|nr:class I SAM-dependent methyltransferase [Deltaproteobacteria bacterium]
MTDIYTTRETCRVCGGDKLKKILALGEQYIINFLDGDSKEEGILAPLDMMLCENKACSLVQLKHTVDPDLLYRNFWYKSGINQTMRNALTDITTQAKKKVPLVSGDIVVDIGANDGTLLRTYNQEGLVTVGFEPALNLMPEARQGTSSIINDYFNQKSFSENFPGKKAKIVTSIAMFYDLENPNQFVDDIKNVLAKDGVWINQMNYLKSMLALNAFDNISHEHLEYYSLSSLEFLLRRHNLEVFDVELNDLNGGSFRAYIGHKGQYPVTDRVQELRLSEAPLSSPEIYDAFAASIADMKSQTSDFIRKAVKEGKKVYAYGASTRGNSLLQFFGLDFNLITAAAERNPVKWGKKMIGTNIPIISEDEARNAKPDYFLILPWAFVKEFVAREKAFFQSGGKFIVPLSKFRVIGQDNL